MAVAAYIMDYQEAEGARPEPGLGYASKGLPPRDPLPLQGPPPIMSHSPPNSNNSWDQVLRKPRGLLLYLYQKREKFTLIIFHIGMKPKTNGKLRHRI